MPGAFDPARAMQMALQIANLKQRRDRNQLIQDQYVAETDRVQREKEMDRIRTMSDYGQELLLAATQNPAGYGLSPETLSTFQPTDHPVLGKDYREFPEYYRTAEKLEGFGEVAEPGPDATSLRLMAEQFLNLLKETTDPAAARVLVENLNRAHRGLGGEGYTALPSNFMFTDPNAFDEILETEEERLKNIRGTGSQPGSLAHRTKLLEDAAKSGKTGALPFDTSEMKTDDILSEISNRLRFATSQGDTLQGLLDRAIGKDQTLVTDDLFGWKPAPYPEGGTGEIKPDDSKVKVPKQVKKYVKTGMKELEQGGGDASDRLVNWAAENIAFNNAVKPEEFNEIVDTLADNLGLDKVELKRKIDDMFVSYKPSNWGGAGFDF